MVFTMIQKQNLIKKSFIGGIFVVFVLILLGMGSTNAIILSTGGKNRNCGDCHTDAGGVTTITVTNWPVTYSLSTQYNIIVNVTDSSLSTGMGGVWISTGSVGILGIGTDLHLKVRSADLIHSDSGATSWTFTWDSPAANSGNVTLIVYAMVINDASGTSGDSWDSVIHISLPPLGPPSAPQLLTSTHGDSQVSLNWDTPTSDGGFAVTQYQVYRGTISGGPYTNIANTTELSYIDNTVTNGITNYYVISAVNAEGEGGYSNEMSATLTTTTTTQSSSTTSDTSTSVATSISATTTTTSSTPIGMLGFLLGIIVISSIRWFKKHEK